MISGPKKEFHVQFCSNATYIVNSGNVGIRYPLYSLILGIVTSPAVNGRRKYF